MSRRRVAALLSFVFLAGAAGLARPVGAAPSRGWVRVQFAERITPENHDALRAAGLTALQYVPDDAYLAFGAATAARRVVGVSDVTPVRPRVRVRPGLVTVLGRGQPTSWLGVPIRSGYEIADGLWAYSLVATPGILDRVAARPEVLFIAPTIGAPELEDEATAQVIVGKIADGYRVQPGYEKWLSSVKLDGSGVTAAIVDDGIDRFHPELSGRIARRYEWSATPADGHGTHVAGIVGGFGASFPGGTRAKDAKGFLYGVGVAPRVSFVDINAIGRTNDDFPPAAGFASYSSQAVASGASVWNSSWHTGEGTGAGYLATAADIDRIVRDADPKQPGNQPLTIVFSAGNAGAAGEMSLTAPHEAKNIITAASLVAPRGGFPNGTAPTKESIAASSSRGPTRDGRFGPTVAAPGGNVVSAHAFTGSTCSTSPPVDGFALYSYCSGTSMAAPHVTGAVALITQWWRQRHDGANASPAMAKALLVNSAADINEPDIPNGDEGWGRVQLGRLFDPAIKGVYVDQSVVFTRRDQQHGLRIAPVDPRKPMRVTLAWTDPPGLPLDEPRDREDLDVLSASALVNDLDLRLEGAGGPYLGNVFARGTSVRGGKPDRRNNLENIYLARPSGTYRLTIRAHNLPGDGIPGNARRIDQDFALVITNARLVG